MSAAWRLAAFLLQSRDALFFNKSLSLLDCRLVTRSLESSKVTNPADWEPDYTEALASALGRRLAIVLDLPNAAQMEGQDEQVETLMAEDIRG